MLEQAPKFMVYGLVDPETKELRYIGKSAQGIARINSHFYPKRLRDDDTYKARWIKKLAAEDIGGHQGMVSNCVSPNHSLYSYKGWRFFYVDKGSSGSKTT